METTTCWSERAVGEIVAENYHTAGVFREVGIDFCCGGKITLAQACTKKKIAIDDVVERLESVGSRYVGVANDYSQWSPSLLVSYIVETHHDFVRRKVDEVGRYAVKVAHVHGERHPENVAIAARFLELANAMNEHMISEEERVFPMLMRVSSAVRTGGNAAASDLAMLASEIEQMEAEHEAAGDLMKQIRALSNDFMPPEDACTTYRVLYQNLEGFEADLHKHVHLENNILFPKVARMAGLA